MSTALIFTVGTIGHFNSAIALAQLLAEGGWESDIVTGAAIRDYALRQVDQINGSIHCLAAFDLDLDRSRPNRRSHFQQVYDADHVAASVPAIRRLIAERRPHLFVTKDFVTPPLCAAEAGIASAAYLTDGVEPLILADRLRKVPLAPCDRATFAAALARVGLAGAERALRGELFGLRLARGYRCTSLVPPARETMLNDVQFVGGLVFDASPHLVEHWRSRLVAMPRPLGFLTFGTVNHDGDAVRRIAIAAAQRLGSVLATHPGGWHDADGLPENLRLERYVPNEAVLSVADVVIHHGGHGTMLSALKHGVPAITMPINMATSAQGLHAEMLASLGVGRTLALDADEDDIGSAIGWATGPVARARCAALQIDLAEADIGLRAETLTNIDRIASARLEGAP